MSTELYLKFKTTEIEALDHQLYLASIELNRRLKTAETEKDESSGQATHYAMVHRWTEENQALRDRLRETIR